MKYGQGGRKKGLRRNTAESSSDMRSFRGYNSRFQGPKHSAKMSKSKRPGKINRHKIKHQRNK